jgi:hypothetical protein
LRAARVLTRASWFATTDYLAAAPTDDPNAGST